MKKANKMPTSIDFSAGGRGKFYGKFKYVRNSRERRTTEQVFGICIKSDDPELLILDKIYQVARLEPGYVEIKDERGDTSTYPAEYFALVSFPPEIEQQLRRAAESHK